MLIRRSPRSILFACLNYHVLKGKKENVLGDQLVCDGLPWEPQLLVKVKVGLKKRNIDIRT